MKKNMNKLAYFEILLYSGITSFFILRIWLTYNDKKQHCECCFIQESAGFFGERSIKVFAKVPRQSLI